MKTAETKAALPEAAKPGVSPIKTEHLQEINSILLAESRGLDHGIVHVNVVVRDSKIQRYVVTREVSILAGGHYAGA